MEHKPHFSFRTWAYLMGAIILGSTLPDADHIFTGTRSWGHNWLYPVIILTGLVVAYLGRFFVSRILRGE